MHGRIDRRADGIRPATADDLPDLLRMGQAFHVKSGLAKFHGFNPDHFATVCRRLIKDDDGLLLIGGGMLGAMAYPVWYSPEDKTAQEIFWWSEGSGQALLEAFETWAAARGAVTVEMGALAALKGAAVARLYRKRGYVAKEQLFIKRL